MLHSIWPTRDRLWVLQESPIEGCKHQDNPNVHDQPFPEPIPKEHEVYIDNNRYHDRGRKEGLTSA
jgi:hypothetical protein